MSESQNAPYKPAALAAAAVLGAIALVMLALEVSQSSFTAADSWLLVVVVGMVAVVVLQLRARRRSGSAGVGS